MLVLHKLESNYICEKQVTYCAQANESQVFWSGINPSQNDDEFPYFISSSIL